LCVLVKNTSHYHNPNLHGQDHQIHKLGDSRCQTGWLREFGLVKLSGLTQKGEIHPVISPQIEVKIIPESIENQSKSSQKKSVDFHPH
jgi:hypothetical protein